MCIRDRATTDNILESIKQNNFNRNKDVKDFIEALDMITGNVFISLDARWGEGKTFYVCLLYTSIFRV